MKSWLLLRLTISVYVSKMEDCNVSKILGTTTTRGITRRNWLAACIVGRHRLVYPCRHHPLLHRQPQPLSNRHPHREFPGTRGLCSLSLRPPASEHLHTGNDWALFHPR